MATWLNKAVFYEIYPQSYYDSNGDGIGDIEGIIEKLDYVKSLGCNAIWLNPCFDSPFKDAGYDVRDYKKVAPRYGTNDDMARLFQVAHKKGIRILLDLVPGHTSEEHEWFKASGMQEQTAMDDRYIWTDGCFEGGDGMPFIGGEQPRSATYIINFFKCQPALNYGYYEVRKGWQQPTDAPGPVGTREAMKDVMRFWLAMGCDGFRVDMAGSLVKNDPEGQPGTMEAWRDMLGAMHEEFPEAAFVSEWNKPETALNCGFDMDFNLNGGNSYEKLMRNYPFPGYGVMPEENNSYFKKDSTLTMAEALGQYLEGYEKSKDLGLWCWLTGNHDTLRLAPMLDESELKLAYAFLFTMPGAPFLYYGDEIGMPYRWIPTKEGGYHRTGSRSPMQWTLGKNLGFSEAEEEKLYLPVGNTDGAPTVQEQEVDPNSLLNFVRKLTAFRASQEDLESGVPFEVYSMEKGSRLFAYKRGKLLIAVNPSGTELNLQVDDDYTIIYSVGIPELSAQKLKMPAQSFTVLKLR